MLRFPFVPLLTTLAFVAPACAQTWMFAFGEIMNLNVYGTTSRDFRSTAAGHLTGFHANDAVVLAGSTPVLVTAPGTQQSAATLPLPAVPPPGFSVDDVRDFAIARRGGEDGRDALVMVTSTGLWRWYMGTDLVTPPNGSPVPTWAVRLEPLGTSVWAGAHRLRSADIDGDGVADVLGLMANGRTIRCLLRGTGGGWTINAEARVRDFVVADLVAGGALEIAAAIGAVSNPQAPFAGGVRVFEPGNPVPIAEAVLPNTTAVLAPLSASGQVGLAMARGDNGQHTLHTFALAAGALVVQDTIGLADEATAIVAGQWRHGQEDLLLTYRTVGAPIEVRHFGNFLLGATSVVPLGQTMVTDNRAVPLLADFYGDPDEVDPDLHCGNKLLYPKVTTGDVVVQRRMGFDERFVAVVSSPAGIGLAMPPVVVGGASPFPSHVEVEMWQVSGSPLQYATTPALSTRAEIFTGVSTWEALLSLPSYESDTAWVMTTRYVQVDATGTVTKRWPVRTTAVSFSGSLTQALYAAAGGIQLATPPTGVVNVCSPPIYCGITGDVVQPPSAPDAGGDPPAPGK